MEHTREPSTGRPREGGNSACMYVLVVMAHAARKVAGLVNHTPIERHHLQSGEENKVDQTGQIRGERPDDKEG